MPTKNKQATTSKKRSRVKVGKLPKSTKELSAKERQKVKGGGSYSETIKVKTTG